MTIAPRTEWESDESREPERESEPESEPEPEFAETSGNPERLSGGAWLSLAMSLTFFLAMVAIGVKYDAARHPRDPSAEIDRSSLANVPVPAPTPVAAIAPNLTAPVDDPNTLLARARECTAAAQWDCVIDATSGVIAQRGTTPETKALLTQAMIKGGWVPGNTQAPSIVGNTHSVRAVSAMPAQTRRITRHRHRHTGRDVHLRYTSDNHHNSTDSLSNIYRN